MSVTEDFSVRLLMNVFVKLNNTILKVFNISGLKRICSVTIDEQSADKVLGVLS